MRLAGRELREEYRRTLLLPRPDGTSWALTVRPLRLGFAQWLRERGVQPPCVPKKCLRDSQGRLMRDAEGLVLTQRDENDAAYLVEVDRYHQRLAALMVWEALRENGEVEFASEVPEGTAGWLEFADALLAELAGAGFTAGDLLWVCEEVALLSNLAGPHAEGSQRHFFRAGEPTANTG